MNDEPCMCGTQAECWADNHVMYIDQAAGVLGISVGAVLVAVHRKRLHSSGKDPDGRHVFERHYLDEYAATRRARRVAQGDRETVRSNRP